MEQIQYFLGANSPSGFYSLYAHLLPDEGAEGIFILKGGPGCGKSSFLRRVARHAQAAGQRCVLVPCSGDPDSLDALILPELGVAIADGTAPHVIEPRYPGAVDSYIDLGRFYDRRGLTPLRQDIIDAADGYKAQYTRVYRCLDAAGALRRDRRELILTPALRARLAKRAAGIIRREIKKNGGSRGTAAPRFLSAVTCRGRLCLWETVGAQARRVYELSDPYGVSHELLSPILAAALEAGHDAVACPDPMAPERLAHLILPGAGLAFVSSAPGMAYPQRPYRRLRLDAMADPELCRANRARLRFSQKVAAALEDEAVSGLARAKEAHDALEALYNPHVDFDGVYAAADALAAQLLEPTASPQ